MPGRPKRFAACEPCRASKLACDHQRPACTRCRTNKREDRCLYRSRPFKKKGAVAEDSSLSPLIVRAQAVDSGQGQEDISVPNTISSSGSRTPVGRPATRRYPDPGYRGSSSHTTLFSQLELNRSDGLQREVGMSRHDINSQPTQLVSDADIELGEGILEHLFRTCPIEFCIKLVKAWLETGANLPLAHAFTTASVRAVENLVTNPGDRIGLAERLFHNSALPLGAASAATSDSHDSQLALDVSRWEYICLFFLSVGRATLAIPYLDSALRVREQRRKILKLSMHYARQTLDLSLSLDCLNDLQLVSQYESFLLQSIVDGDENFGCYRKLGDVASSIFALGYHQDITAGASCPALFRLTREAAFAHAYSSDKNVSIFLGRPLRLSKNVCQFPPIGLEGYFSYEWSEDTPLDFRSEARWAAMCAVLKDDCIGLLKAKGDENASRKARIIQDKAALQWSSLPQHFRLEAPLISHDLDRAELDLLLGVRLNHLHVLFLVQFALLHKITEPNVAIVTVSAEILGLVVEAVLLRGRIIDSSTSLVWKVIYYGLSAAGILCLALLRPSPFSTEEKVDVNQILRDLAALTAVVDKGSLVDSDDANYALLARATEAMKAVLDRMSFNSRHHPPLEHTMEEDPHASCTMPTPTSNWDSWGFNYFQDLQNPFWQTIAEGHFDPTIVPEMLAS